MFLFHITKSNRYILHTGDFRYDSKVINEPINKLLVDDCNKIDLVYLDTTYLDSYYTFSPQSTVIMEIINRIRKDLVNEPKTLIVCGSYTVGKEKIYLNIANELNLKIYVNRDKKKILDCINVDNNELISKNLTTNQFDAHIHVVTMNYIHNIDLLLNYYKQYSNVYSKVIGLRPTGWSYDNSSSSSSNSIISVAASKSNATIYGNYACLSHTRPSLLLLTK